MIAIPPHQSKYSTWSYLAITSVGLVLAAACSDTADDCTKTATCKVTSAGSSSLGGAETGGAPLSTGGTENTAGGGAMAGSSNGVVEAGAGGAGAIAVAGAAGALGTAGAAGAPHQPCDGLCGAATPYCDNATDQCVACLDDQQCPATSPACSATHTCVGCAKDLHCGATAPACDTTTNSCVACVADAHCTAPTPACTAAHSCVECTKNAHCTGAKAVCNVTANACVECVSNVDCAGSPGKPVCDTATNVCVGCLANTDCAATPTTALCHPTKKACVACLANLDCTAAATSKCDTATTNSCTPCAVDADCSQITGKAVCLAGSAGQPNQCVQCTAANETACGTGATAHSCNPKTNACTTTNKGSRKSCQPCAADSECGDASGAVDANKRCVPMTFKGASHGAGGYCLQRRAALACAQPYAVLFTAASLSGAAPESYCGINQDATTCEAVLDLSASKICTADTDCGGTLASGTQGGGLCKTNLATGDLRCTIPCDSSVQCLASAPGNVCEAPDVPYCH